MNVKGIKHKPQGTAEKGNEIVAKWVFFSENAGELCIIILRRKNG